MDWVKAQTQIMQFLFNFFAKFIQQKVITYHLSNVIYQHTETQIPIIMYL